VGCRPVVVNSSTALPRQVSLALSHRSGSGGTGRITGECFGQRSRVAFGNDRQTAFHRARRLVPRATFHRADMTEIPFPRASFSAVVSLFALNGCKAHVSGRPCVRWETLRSRAEPHSLRFHHFMISVERRVICVASRVTSVDPCGN
jgi:hypothetical protein